jgi:1-acyl-sn-glycerol-3-phosphate acyltransferase
VLLQKATRAVLVPLSRLAFLPTIEGRHHIPRKGPVIFAVNHLSFVDSFLVPLMTPRSVAFLAKSEYFQRPGVIGGLTRACLLGIDAIPVQRGANRAAQASLESALEVLAAGGAFGIHPEGSRSRDGRLYRGRTGVAWLALTSGAPVIPVALLGTHKIQPVGKRLPRPGRITVRFGAPLRFQHRGEAGNARLRRAVTDEIMAAIASLSGQEQAGRFNEVSAPGDLGDTV